MNNQDARSASSSSGAAYNFLGTGSLRNATAPAVQSTTIQKSSAKTTAPENAPSNSASLKESCGKLGTVVARLSESDKFYKKLVLLQLEKRIKAGDTQSVMELISNNTDSIYPSDEANLEPARNKLLKKTQLKGLLDMLKSKDGTLVYKLMDLQLHYNEDDKRK